MKDVTVKDVAEAAGVSPAVVSRVKNGDTTLRISKDTLARVNRVIQDLDFEPNAAARSLRSSRSGLIAVVVHDISNAVYAEIIRGLQSGANKANMAILLADAEGVTASKARLLELVGGGGVDGLILMAADKVPDQFLARAVRNKVPIVLLQAQLELEARLVVLPDELATRVATEHLLSIGHRDVACLATVPGLSFTNERLKGWRGALVDAGAEEVADRVFCSGQSGIAEGHEAATRLFSKHPSVSGIVCLNPLIAVGAMQCAQEMGLMVPDDLSIVSVHDLSYAGHLKVPLTTVSTPLFELGEQAVEVLMDPQLPANYRRAINQPTPQLILRRSTGAPRRCARGQWDTTSP